MRSKAMKKCYCKQVEESAATCNVCVTKLLKVIEAAREVIGKNVTRPEVYAGRDTSKHKLAIALQSVKEFP